MTLQAIFAISLWTLSFMTAIVVFRRPAVLASGLVFGWLFLPNFSVNFPGLPDFDKQILVSVVSFGLMFAIPRRGQSAPWLSWLDFPALGITLFSIPASVTNGLGLYDGLSSAYSSFWVWTVPYFIGRRVFCTQETAITLIRVVILGGLVYAAFCIYEIKMSPRLHWVIYGMLPRPGQNYFNQAIRYGLWRPTVFMEHGLALAILMSITSTLAWWAHVSSAIPRLAGLSMRTVAGILGMTTVLCVSSGAIALMALGWGIAYLGRGQVGRATLLLAAMLPFVYPVSRMLGSVVLVDAVVSMTEVAAEQTGEARTGSFQVRVDNEERILQNWQSGPWFGRAMYYRESDEKKAIITDSFWIIMLGKYGLCGWICWTTMLVMPGIVVAFRTEMWKARAATTAICLSLGCILYAIDGLLNAMPNPIFLLLTGAASSIAGQVVSLSDQAMQSIGKTLPVRVARRQWPSLRSDGGQ